jgi:hypothetical protein
MSEIESTATGIKDTLNSIGNIADDGIKNVLDTGEATYDNFKQETGYDSSSYWGYSKETGYSSEKTQSTIGEGSLIIRDMTNSDELNGLNRDINNINKYLYGGGTKVSIPIFNYGVIVGEVISGFPHVSGEKNLFDDILSPSALDIEKYRLKNDMKDNILKQ